MQRITYSPDDCVSGCEQIQDASILEFWQWAFGDLCDDDVNGIYAEWVVQQLLRVETSRRISWANSEIITPGGTRIEVNSTAYWQSWKFLNERGEPEVVSEHTPRKGDIGLRFGGLKTRDSNWSKDQTFKSDLYVFAFQKERRIDQWNALALRPYGMTGSQSLLLVCSSANRWRKPPRFAG